jgi:hypothetical protein
MKLAVTMNFLVGCGAVYSDVQICRLRLRPIVSFTWRDQVYDKRVENMEEASAECGLQRVPTCWESSLMGRE